ncbi:MAG: lytic murein transglycosylase [Candidatus Wildermuthbacteria bacterium]|nr:lytic murein transglycosylase [Candidatus Wildermuthbacteria bacterium]
MTKLRKNSRALCVFAFLVIFPLFAFALTPQEERSSLEQELAELEAHIREIENDITKTQAEKNTLQKQITILKDKIQKLNLQIAQGNRVIADLSSQIGDTTESIEKTSQEIESIQEQIGTVLRTIHEEDRKGLLEMMLTSGSLSDFFLNLSSLEALGSKSAELLNTMRSLGRYLETQKTDLETDKATQENLVKIQLIQKIQSQQAKTDQESLLTATKGKESEYQKMLVDRKKRAGELRSRIFELIGVSKAPTFGEALEIARAVSKQTGIRPALLLAVLTQESNIGKNVGQCYLKNTQTGSGTKTTGAAVSKVMSPARDIPKFLEIARELGRDPLNTPVSCPIPSVGGWGGAMGPAQFIPSTWSMYQKELNDMAGRPVDPWNIKDAFLATGVYLEDLGGQQNEFRAVMRYFSGPSWTKYEEFYGRSVLSIAAGYEEDIKELEGS